MRLKLPWPVSSGLSSISVNFCFDYYSSILQGKIVILLSPLKYVWTTCKIIPNFVITPLCFVYSRYVLYIQSQMQLQHIHLIIFTYIFIFLLQKIFISIWNIYSILITQVFPNSFVTAQFFHDGCFPVA